MNTTHGYRVGEPHPTAEVHHLAAPTVPTPSGHADELAARFGAVVRAYLDYNPSCTPGEIRRALHDVDQVLQGPR